MGPINGFDEGDVRAEAAADAARGKRKGPCDDANTGATADNDDDDDDDDVLCAFSGAATLEMRPSVDAKDSWASKEPRSAVNCGRTSDIKSIVIRLEPYQLSLSVFLTRRAHVKGHDAAKLQEIRN